MGKLLTLLVTGFPFAATAGPYGPFDPDENYVAPLDGCESVVDVRQVHPPFGTVDLSRAGDQAKLRLSMEGITHYRAQVLIGPTPAGEAVHVDVQATMPTDIGTDQAVCDDLNRDGATDFVVSLWRHGNGLGASFYDRLAVLSSGKTYRFWVIPAVNPGREDFVRLSGGGPILMVTSEFVQKDNSDAEPASYFVYDLWSFTRGEVVTGNSLDRRFPKWVRYTPKPNSGAALSLSDGDKRRLRSSAPQPVEALP